MPTPHINDELERLAMAIDIQRAREVEALDRACRTALIIQVMLHVLTFVMIVVAGYVAVVSSGIAQIVAAASVVTMPFGINYLVRRIQPKMPDKLGSDELVLEYGKLILERNRDMRESRAKRRAELNNQGFPFASDEDCRGI